MNKEEIKHFKSLLRQGSLRHMNILLDDKFQKELLTIIKDYEKLQQENLELKEDISFCLHSIKQEMEMSTDSRTRNEMTSCYEILKRWNKWIIEQ